MHWIANYIGLPYVAGGRDRTGVDCWGLLVLIYRERFGIVLPPAPGIATASVLMINSTMVDNLLREWEKLEVPEEGCLVAMSQCHAMHHVGIYVSADGGKIVHGWKSQSVVADTIRGLVFKGIRTVAYYRHHLWKEKHHGLDH